MKLFFADTSPYARKARIAILEKALQDRVEMIAVNPYDLPPDLVAANPLGKVPALVRDGAASLYDSNVICEYLDSLADSPRLFPADAGEARWTAQRRLALTDGILDQTYNLACEVYRRPEGERSPGWIDRWIASIRRALAGLADEIGDYGQAATMASIGAGVALGYVDLRAGDRIDWRTSHPVLADWYGGFAARASMRATRPH